MKYYAITLGPLTATIKSAKKTREVWAASYLFSWMMKNILEKIKPDNTLSIILPFSSEIKKSQFGAGMYADRAYFSAENTVKGKEIIEKAVSDFLVLLSKDISKHLPKYSENHALQFLKSYLSVHTIESKECNAEDPIPLEILNQRLDQAELFQKFIFNIDSNPLAEYLAINKGTELFKDAFGESDSSRKFLSVSEIASATFSRLNPELYSKLLNESFKKNDAEFLDSLQNEKGFMPHHKYFGVLYADGDNISSVLVEAQKSQDKLQQFSKNLFDFTKKAEVTIKNYGGNGIYLGGDDIMAFIPMAYISKDGNSVNNVFDLIAQLDIDFYDTIGKFAESISVVPPTISYGLMISYFKNPLKEAMAKAYSLLSEAKSGSKNKIGFCFQKHSGQRIECFYDKKYLQSQAAISGLLNANIKKDALLTGLMHKFNEDYYFQLYEKACELDSLDAFYDNFLNDAIHKDSSYIAELKTFSKQIIKDYAGGIDKKSSKAVIFSTLRYLQFIKTEKE
jgi:CRISPR-associated protein Cmr2